MLYLIITVLLVVIVFAPQWWVRYVLKKHAKPMAGMPGTGGELAKHLLERFELSEVKLEQGNEGDNYYSPDENKVCLSPDVFNGKSLTAVASAAHEVGHAIQFNRKEPVSFLRGKYLHNANRIQNLGIMLLSAMPVIAVAIRIPHLTLITLLIGVVTMLASVVMYMAILPEEWDASFNKALPILVEGDYVPEEYLPAIREVLKACALTYVAAALADVLSIWRWLYILRA